MTVDFTKGKFLKALIRRLCFMAFGISTLANPTDFFNIYAIGFGALLGLIFGWLFRLFLKGFLNSFNSSFKKEWGKEAITYAVDSGMLFLTPFAIMLLLATFYLHWSLTVPFISAGIMAAGTATAIEIGKIQGQQGIKNTVTTSIVSFVFSFLWTIAYPFVFKIPPLLEGGISLIRSLIGGGRL